MANTTNFGWETPDDTDLVKDGAAAMRTLGNSIDTSMGDLKGGTSGQILSKNSNTDMDFVWITNDIGDITAVTAGTGISGGGTSGDVTITNTMATAIDAKGDLIAGTGADTFSRLAIGANDTVLTADSSTATGLKWATPSSGSMTLLSTTSLSGSTNNITGISGSYNRLMIEIINTYASAGSSPIQVRLNGTNGNHYGGNWFNQGGSMTFQGYNNNPMYVFNNNGQTKWSSTTYKVNASVLVDNYASSTAEHKPFVLYGSYADNNIATTFKTGAQGGGAYYDTTAITSVTIYNDNSLTGTVKIWGIK